MEVVCFPLDKKFGIILQQRCVRFVRSIFFDNWSMHSYYVHVANAVTHPVMQIIHAFLKLDA